MWTVASLEACNSEGCGLGTEWRVRLSQDMGAVNLEADGLLRDALVVAHCALCLIQDLLPDSVKVVEALACMMTDKLCGTGDKLYC